MGIEYVAPPLVDWPNKEKKKKKKGGKKKEEEREEWREKREIKNKWKRKGWRRRRGKERKIKKKMKKKRQWREDKEREKRATPTFVKCVKKICSKFDKFDKCVGFDRHVCQICQTNLIEIWQISRFWKARFLLLYLPPPLPSSSSTFLLRHVLWPTILLHCSIMSCRSAVVCSSSMLDTRGGMLQ